MTNDGKMLVHGLALSQDAATGARRRLFARKRYGLASVSVVHPDATHAESDSRQPSSITGRSPRTQASSPAMRH